MRKFVLHLVKHRTLVVGMSFLLILASVLVIMMPRVSSNVYLSEITEKEMENMPDNWSTGSVVFVMTEGLKDLEQYSLEKRLRNVGHVSELIGYSSLTEGNLPAVFLPKRIQKRIQNGKARLCILILDDQLRSENTQIAIQELRKVAEGACQITGPAVILAECRQMLDMQLTRVLLAVLALTLIVSAIASHSVTFPASCVSCIVLCSLTTVSCGSILDQSGSVLGKITVLLQMLMTLGYSVILWKIYREQMSMGVPGDEAIAEAVAVAFPAFFCAGLILLICCTAVCFLSGNFFLEQYLQPLYGTVICILVNGLTLPCMIRMLGRRVTYAGPGYTKTLVHFDLRHYIALSVAAMIMLVVLVTVGCVMPWNMSFSSALFEHTESLKVQKAINDTFGYSNIYRLSVDGQMTADRKNDMIRAVKNVPGVTDVTEKGPFEAFFTTTPFICLQEGGTQFFTFTLVSEGKITADEQLRELQEILQTYEPEATLQGEAITLLEWKQHMVKILCWLPLIWMAAGFAVTMAYTRSIMLPLLSQMICALSFFPGLAFFIDHQHIQFIAVPALLLIIPVSHLHALMVIKSYIRERKSKKRKEAGSCAVRTCAHPIVFSACIVSAVALGSAVITGAPDAGKICCFIVCATGCSALLSVTCLPAAMLSLDRLIVATTSGICRAD